MLSICISFILINSQHFIRAPFVSFLYAIHHSLYIFIVVFFLSLCFSLVNFYWHIFKFTAFSPLVCWVNDQRAEGLLYFYYIYIYFIFSIFIYFSRVFIALLKFSICLCMPFTFSFVAFNILISYFKFPLW